MTKTSKSGKHVSFPPEHTYITHIPIHVPGIGESPGSHQKITPVKSIKHYFYIIFTFLFIYYLLLYSA